MTGAAGRVLLSRELPAEYTQQSMNNRVIARFWNCVPSAPAVYQRRRRSPQRRRQAPREMGRLGLGSLQFWAVSGPFKRAFSKGGSSTFSIFKKSNMLDDERPNMAKANRLAFGIDHTAQRAGAVFNSGV